MFLLTIILIKLILSQACDINLYNVDFVNGTIRIDTDNVKICIEENIIFEPNDSYPTNNGEYPGCKHMRNGTFSLGFFSAISIESSNVEIDLQQHSIKMGDTFYIQQRWFSLIEIGRPFIVGQGPGDFGNVEIDVSNITIKNGVLGLSSHHGIHGNNVKNVLIENLQINNFEVCGIQFNGFSNVEIRNIDIGPSSKRAFLNGYYSNARFTLISLTKAEIYHNHTTINFNNDKELTYQQIYINLQTTLDLAKRYVLNENTQNDRNNPLFDEAIELFINKDGLPDGSAIYGILLNSKGVAVNDFGTSPPNNGGNDVNINNVSIHNLELSVAEIPIMGATKTMKGMFGDVMNIRSMIDDYSKILLDNNELHANIKYKGNALSDAQILGAITNMYNSELSDLFLQWLDEEIIPNEIMNIHCGSDIMEHKNKGVMGMRLDNIENVNITNITIRNLINYSPLPTILCQKNTIGTNSTNIKGIVLINTDITIYGKNIINNIESHNGNSMGIHLLEDSFLDNQGELLINKISSSYEYHEDDELDFIKNEIYSCNIKKHDNATLLNQENSECYYKYEDDDNKNKNKNKKFWTTRNIILVILGGVILLCVIPGLIYTCVYCIRN